MRLKEKIILYLNRHNLLLYIIISTLYFEFVFHISCFKGITFINTVNIILFTLPICLLIYLLSTLFNKKINKKKKKKIKKNKKKKKKKKKNIK